MPDREEYLLEMSERTLRFFSPSQLAMIADKTIALAGLGGIGAMVLELLARMGVMKFRLMDMDRYEISNLNRQILATRSTLGSWKVDVAVARIRDINPYAEIELIVREKANRENVQRFVRGADVFILGTDSPSSILLFHEFARRYKVPLVDGHCISVIGGTVQVFDYRDPKQVCRVRPFRSPIFNAFARKILGVEKEIEQFTDEELEQLDQGQLPSASLGFVTNLIACVVVSETIKLLTGIGRIYRYPKEIYINLLNPTMKVRSTRSFKKAFLRLKQRLSKR